MNEIRTKVLVIESGPAGYTAAIHAARANLQPVLVTGIQPGGQLATTDVENFPEFAQAVQGPELMDQMRQRAEHVGVSIILDTVTTVDLSQEPILALGDSARFLHPKIEACIRRTLREECEVRSEIPARIADRNAVPKAVAMAPKIEPKCVEPAAIRKRQVSCPRRRR